MDFLIAHVPQFLVHIRIERNYSPQTEASYRFALGILSTFLAEMRMGLTDTQCVAQFICYLRERGNSDVTIAHRLAVMKSFFAYLARKGLVKKRSLPVIEHYRTTRKIIAIPADEQVNLFIRTMEDEYLACKHTLDSESNASVRLKAKTYSLFRNLVFFTLMTATGLRISEALRIKAEDLNWSDCSIKILGKGEKERLMYFGIERLKNLLTTLRQIQRRLGIESPYLFVSYQHKKPLSPRYIQKTMKAFLEKTSSASFTPHTLRHYYATRSIEKGANIKAIAVLLGHANVSTTLKMYCHISAAYLREVFETLNPFANITLPVEQMIHKRYEVLVNF